MSDRIRDSFTQFYAAIEKSYEALKGDRVKIEDRKTGMLSNYYYHRRRGVLKRRVATPEQIFGNPSG